MYSKGIMEKDKKTSGWEERKQNYYKDYVPLLREEIN